MTPAGREILWTSKDVAAATGGRSTGGDWTATGISIDSRTVQPGDLFIAVKGETHDGHAFVDAAFARGASGALVGDGEVGEVQGPAIRVADPQQALERLGAAGRRRSSAGIVAVTGSVGKTSTKEALRHVLGAQAPTSASAASFNNHLGVPISLARLPPSARYAVLEIGMNHPGEIAPLARQVKPHVGVITEIAPVHIEFFESVAAIAVEKAHVFDGMQSGTAILNRDSEYFDLLAAEARRHGASTILGFGTHEAADLRMLSCVADGDGSDVVAEWQGRKLRYRVGAAGLHWARNCLAVLTAVNALGGDLAGAAESLATVQAVAGRGARRRLQLAAGTIDLVDESYNASPTSVRAMLGVLGTMPRRPGRRRVLVLGDMRELGSQSDALHESLVPDVVACGVDLVFACGPHMRRLYESLPAHVRAAHSADSAGLAPLLVEALRDGDVVAVKGSLGSKMKTVVEALLAAERTRAEAA